MIEDTEESNDSDYVQEDEDEEDEEEDDQPVITRPARTIYRTSPHTVLQEFLLTLPRSQPSASHARTRRRRWHTSRWWCLRRR